MIQIKKFNGNNHLNLVFQEVETIKINLILYIESKINFIKLLKK